MGRTQDGYQDFTVPLLLYHFSVIAELSFFCKLKAALYLALAQVMAAFAQQFSLL
jgi:hypothetical protein